MDKSIDEKNIDSEVQINPEEDKSEKIKEKQKAIRAELRRLNKIFENIPDDRKSVVQPMIQNVAFMTVELSDLQKIIQEHGSIDFFENGKNQKGYKVSAPIQAYNSLAKTWTTAVKVLLGELTDGTEKSAAQSSLATFMTGGKRGKN